MRIIRVEDITSNVAQMCCEANLHLGQDVKDALVEALKREESPAGKEVLKQLLENAEIAKREKIPLCQDTGVTVVFLEMGREVMIEGGDPLEAVNQGVEKGYRECYLRKSMVGDPLKRKNTGTNTPAVIHWEIVPGDKLKITVAPKGGGSENMSALKVLKPAQGEKGVTDFVLETVRKAGANPCPPLIVGVGLGGTIEKAALLAKKALLRPIGQPNSDSYYAQLEKVILEKVNNLGIGPQGFGGRITALAVHIEYFATHIASLPVAINLNCHASRHVERVL
ncbi:MAG: fumarate hydratase [Candidatus Syntrophonatronum acetioxidans]|uniref:Fumarate hydratase n=1 Tax=Candidatus Syntrophonatronum acetioxidans TaxID=1795816 RepID=A0A424YAJ6_9FIRM|nr:MAG: fumarate hydratase [Candidatus Syntrophonatronum acetioxidans]